jgi:chorismate mutase/prephenate dehydratase
MVSHRSEVDAATATCASGGAAPAELDARLRPLRDRIDEIDSRLVGLLNQRAALAMEVGQIKSRVKAPVFRPERERQVIARVLRENAGPLRGEHLAAVWREIMAASRMLEKRLSAAYLGPAGTYSEEAMFAHFGHGIDGVPCPSIDRVFHAVERGEVDYGIVPIENSTEGMVSCTLDLLLASSATIGAEAILPIRHHLLTVSGSLKGVTRVYAHPQALAQCQRWLSTEAPSLERHAVSSTAEAARLAAADNAVAAIAGDRARELYGLQTAFPMIHDEPHNRTRFLVVGGETAASTGNDQTSLAVAVGDGPSAVHRMLEPLARHRVSVIRLESRPARRRAWEYYFFIDVEGHCEDAPVTAALTEIRDVVTFMKPLGSYPRAS